MFFFESHIEGVGQVLVRVDGASFPSGLLGSLLKDREIDVALIRSSSRPLALVLPFDNQSSAIHSFLSGLALDAANQYGQRFVRKLPEDISLASEFGSLDPRVEFLHRTFSCNEEEGDAEFPR